MGQHTRTATTTTTARLIHPSGRDGAPIVLPNGYPTTCAPSSPRLDAYKSDRVPGRAEVEPAHGQDVYGGMQLPAIGIPEVIAVTGFAAISFVAWKFVQAIQRGYEGQ